MANVNQNGAAGYTESVSAVTATNTVSIGTRRYEGGREWLYVYNGNTEQWVPGRGVRLASGATGYTGDIAIPAATTFSAAVCLGVVVNATITTGAYGWIARQGFVQLENFGATSIGAGEPVVLHTSGTFTRYSAPTDNAKYSLDWGFGKACEAQATTTTGSFTAYISCR
jgi:hypothetical protein